jgi:hypothetical protein
MASATPTVKTPSPTARRCAPIAPATAEARPASHLALDTSLRSGDVVATTDGLVAYTGVRLGAEQAAEFTPVASYPGLTASVRARLGEMKVAPVSAEMVGETVMPETRNEIAMPASVVPKSAAPKAAKRAEVN